MLLLSELHLSRKHRPSALAPSTAINRNRTLGDETGLGRPKAPRAGCAWISLDRLEARLLAHYSFVATTEDGAVMATTVGNSRRTVRISIYFVRESSLTRPHFVSTTLTAN